MKSRNRHHHLKGKKDLPKQAKIIPSAEPEPVPAKEVMIDRAWMPTSYTAFKAILSARLCAAVWSNISDCDEVYNYWEPLHYLLYSSGFQTWEYSPLYAIRSYAYILLHSILSFVYSEFLQSNKVLVFYFMRCILGFVSALCEVYFYRCVCQHFGASIGRLMLVFQIFATGMFISSTAFLPSSFSMYLSTIALASWFVQKHEITVLATAASVILGWPFAIILSLPAAYDILILKKQFSSFVKWSLVALGAILIPTVLIDTYYFGKFVIAPLNIVLYNVFTSHGANLYGTEPYYFYSFNLFLNFNVGFLASVVSVPCVLLLQYAISKHNKTSPNPSFLMCISPLYLWMAVFCAQGHKEERFLFPIYPLLCLSAAISLDCLQKIVTHFRAKKKFSHSTMNWTTLSFCIVFAVLSLSRTIMVYRGYRAPIETFMELNKISMDDELHPLPSELPVNVCIGKEWYRFPSSFFLPPDWNLQFVKSEFRGQLPKQFSNLPNATRIIPTNMNDKNMEEPTRYVDLRHCDYLIDSDMPVETVYEPRYSKDENSWEIMSSIPFLDAQRSPRLFRAFYIPYLSEYKCSFVQYDLLQNRRIRDRIAKARRRLYT